MLINADMVCYRYIVDCCSCIVDCCRSLKLMLLGMLVIIVFAVCWLPFLNDLESARSVLVRLFPFGRGLYEVGLVQHALCQNVLTFLCTADLIDKRDL